MKATLGSKIPPSQAMAATVLAWLRKVSTQDQQHFHDKIPNQHGTPKELIANQGLQFTSHYWIQVMKDLGIKNYVSIL
ncbi:hypothetical protein DSO57_1034929 [Entomophthora muscae]|uniref:Uncharacterized protein n=1 Tax=Entomophthora muscae TaxID=34485 RepID=A0ACC2SZT5_9FUNG|nr:hypothetical protein DSO57_1034929 [Entomophthora muscae]